VGDPNLKDRNRQELNGLAEGLPFKVIPLPSFDQKNFVPPSVRQPREYVTPDAAAQAIGRFLVERGTVDILTGEMVEALFTEMHWCGRRIQKLAQGRYRGEASLREAVIEARRLISRIEAAEEELFIANRRLVVSCVKPFFWIGQVWISDFLQEGSRALSNAIRKFDFTRGTPFYAYAQRAIQNRLRNFFRDHVRSGSIGVRPTREMTQLMEIFASCREHNQPEPENETLARLTQIPIERVAKLRPFVRQWENTPAPPVSLDALIGESDTNLYNYVEADETSVASNAAERTEIWNAISQLPERSAYIMKLRFIEGRTLEETGQLLNLTRARIKQIEDDAVKKLRFMLRRGKLDE